MQGGDQSWNILCGGMWCLDSSTPQTARLGLAQQAWGCPCSSPSSAPFSWPHGTVLSRASQVGPVPFKPLELFPAVP